MGKPVSSNVPRAETTALNTKVNKELFTAFKDRCAYHGYPMNMVLETFMHQYANDRYALTDTAILKWKNTDSEDDVLNTTFNKKYYLDFKATCKANGYFVKHVIMAFMADFAGEKVTLEYIQHE